MAVDKVLTRAETVEIYDTTWKAIGGITNLAWSGGASSAETTDFDSAGYAESMVAERTRALTIEGLFLEAPLIGGDYAAFLTVTHLASGAGTVTITLDSGTPEDIVVTLALNDPIATVATKIAAAITADSDWVATSNGAEVTITEAASAEFTAAFVDTDTTGVTVATVIYSGARNAGQAAVDALAKERGADSVGQYRLTTPGGTVLTFYATTENADLAGGNNDPLSWGANLTVTGTVTET